MAVTAAFTAHKGRRIVVNKSGHVAEGKHGEIVEAVQLSGEPYPPEMHGAQFYIVLFDGEQAGRWLDGTQFRFEVAGK